VGNDSRKANLKLRSECGERWEPEARCVRGMKEGCLARISRKGDEVLESVW
jgi:hypothetical protein